VWGPICNHLPSQNVSSRGTGEVGWLDGWIAGWHSPGIHVVEHASGLDEEGADAGGLDVRMSKDFQLQPQSLIKANL